MKLPNNEGDKFPSGYLLSTNESSTTKIELHLNELLAKRVP